MPDSESPAPTNKRGVSVRWMMLLTTCAAISFAALMKPDSYWAPLLTNLNVAVQLAAIVTFFYARAGTRAFAAGFTICNGFFLVVEFIPWLGKPIVRNMLPYALWSADSPLLIGEYSQKRAFMGLLVSGFIYGYGGAVLARWLSSSNCPKAGGSTS